MKSILLLLLVCLAAGKVVLFTRHGQRSPTKYNADDKARWGQFAPGMLTANGVEYLVSRGGRLGRKLPIYDANGLCDPSKIDIVSSLSSRTIMSTFAYTKGFCPKNFKAINNLFVQEYLAKYATQQEDLQNLLNSDFERVYELSPYSSSFKMDPDYLFHGQDNCERSVAESDQVLNREDVIRKTQEYITNPEYANILEIIKRYYSLDYAQNPQNYQLDTFSLSNMKKFYSNRKCNSAQGFEVPQLTEQQEKFLNQISTYVFYDENYGSKNLLVADLSETYRWLINALKSTDKTFHWYSAHDSNQVAILQSMISQFQRDALGLKSLPPFGSDLQFVEYDGKVNVFYNEEILQTQMCQTGLNCTVDEVVAYLNRYMVQDMDAFCQQRKFAF